MPTFRPRRDGGRRKFESSYVRPVEYVACGGVTEVDARTTDSPEQLELQGLMRPGRRRRSASRGERRKFTVAGLFAGVGGIERGLTRSGHQTSLLCENDPAATAVLRARFPAIELCSDIRELEALPPDTTLVTAGFPCQDLSQAGRTAGITGAKSGLVGEVFRLIRRQSTPWVLLENVPFMLQLARGAALDVIIDALEELGYSWAYRVVDSRAFGLPQRRERVFLLASLNEDPRSVLLADEAAPNPEPDPTTVACGFYWTEGVRGLGWAVDAVPTLKGGSTIGIPSPPAILLPNGSGIVKPDIRDAERMQGFPADWTKPAEAVVKRGCRWKLVGNAVTVNVAEWLGRRLALPGEYDATDAYPLKRGSAWPRCAWNVGGGRHGAAVGSFPVARSRPPLLKFLRYPTEPLSPKATAGFLSRARSGSLRFPEGFLAAVERHLENVSTAVAA